MNLRTTLLAAAVASSACSISVPAQFSCPEPGKPTGCGTNQICGPDKLCTTLVTCLSTEDRCNGVCVDITHNRENCGACGTVCGPSQQCVSGKCTDFCATGQTACQQSTGGFICQNLSNDRTNCGTCGNVCPQGQVCTPTTAGGPGHCAVECAGTLTNCSGNCLDLATDDGSCGACGSKCSTGTHCAGGHCGIVCTPGQTECPAGSGNCVNTDTDRANCGGCGVSCAAGQICVTTTTGTGTKVTSCQVSCQAGLTLCGSTCVNTVADAANCGGCGITCAAGQVCTNHGPGNSGLCELRCPSGETPCGYAAWNPGTAYVEGNQVTNGGNLYQCTAAGTSAASGGPSGTGTGIADSSVTWKFVSVAPTGASQCVNLQSDRNACGACNDVTNSRACGSGQVCLSGACVVSCAAGLTNCNGACIDTANDPTNCGACGTICSAQDAGGPVCTGGVCGVSCPSGQIICGGKCINPSSDPSFCGAAAPGCTGGTDCSALGQVCSSGGCKLLCPPGSVACGGKCIDPLTDNAHCGASGTCTAGTAGTPCPQGQVCSAGACAATCSSPPFSTCDPGTPTAYCADRTTDRNNCGTCHNICPLPANASDSFCASGACGTVCKTGYASCTTPDQCETNLAGDAAHCGTCSNACPAADNAAPACANSACGTACTGTFLDCDLDSANGCESDKTHDAANCLGCGTLCSGTSPYCGAAGCVAFAGESGVQQNLRAADVEAVSEWGAPCFSESYSHVGTTLAQIQAACPTLTSQVLIACAAPGSPVLLAAAAGPRASVFAGGPAPGATFYVPGAGVPAFGFLPDTASTAFTVAATSYAFDVGGSSVDGFLGGAGSQRLSWPVAGGVITAGGRCGDRVGSSATGNYQRLVFTK